ncbi:hypothetical protein FOL47_009296 [Perkinsus chesapeaki]|uniref:Uncharacterized protein n=1 Tax=Perkinsus chesapeaki TaxID=330153 RepID=A0A7J6MSU9_PERCH|nr:hypothetical protein FOL47_009296 [Perkinsus chesapeaki]
MPTQLPPSKLPPKVDLTHRSCLVSENSKIACIRDFNADGEDGLRFGETALVSTVSPNPTDKVWSCLVEKDDNTCIIVPDYYLVEIDDTSNEWVKPRQLFVALNNSKAAQYNHINIEAHKPNMWFMEDLTVSTKAQRVWGWTNIDNVIVAPHKSATEVNYPLIARQYLGKLQSSAASILSSSEAVGKFRELAFDRVNEHDFVYVKDCLWDIAGCGFAYGHKKDCLEEGWIPTRCLVNLDMVRTARRGGKTWQYAVIYEEDALADGKRKIMAAHVTDKGAVGAPESIIVNDKGEDIALHRHTQRHHRSRTTSTRPVAQRAAAVVRSFKMSVVDDDDDVLSRCSSVQEFFLPYKHRAAVVIQRYIRERWKLKESATLPWWIEYGVNCRESVPLESRMKAAVVIQRRFRWYLHELLATRRMRYLRYYEQHGELMPYDEQRRRQPLDFARRRQLMTESCTKLQRWFRAVRRDRQMSDGVRNKLTLSWDLSSMRAVRRGSMKATFICRRAKKVATKEEAKMRSGPEAKRQRTVDPSWFLSTPSYFSVLFEEDAAEAAPHHSEERGRALRRAKTDSRLRLSSVSAESASYQIEKQREADLVDEVACGTAVVLRGSPPRLDGPRLGVKVVQRRLGKLATAGPDMECIAAVLPSLTVKGLYEERVGHAVEEGDRYRPEEREEECRSLASGVWMAAVKEVSGRYRATILSDMYREGRERQKEEEESDEGDDRSMNGVAEEGDVEEVPAEESWHCSSLAEELPEVEDTICLEEAACPVVESNKAPRQVLPPKLLLPGPPVRTRLELLAHPAFGRSSLYSVYSSRIR